MILSPTIIKGSFKEKERSSLSEVRRLIFLSPLFKRLPSKSLALLRSKSANLSFNALIKSGLDPQHPPIILAPLFKRSSISVANSEGSISYMVCPSTTDGMPALGLAIIGIVVTSAIFLITAAILSGPVEQLAPTATAPRDSSTTAAHSGVVP